MRRELAEWMFARVAAACRASEGVSDLLAVVGDSDGAALAAAHGVPTLVESRPGLRAALAAADAATARAPATIIVAADLPLATGAAIDAVCAAGSASPAVVIVPTRDGGTGALLRRPPDVVETGYGAQSAQRHLRLAADAGVAGRCLEIPALAYDIDTPEQLREAGQLDDQVRRWSLP